MSQPGTISLERPAPKITTITFSNPPVNLVIGETVTRLHQLVAELGDDPAVQVVVFKSGVPTSSSTTSTSRPPQTSPCRRAATRCRSGPTWCCG
jgi:hypothetical protein